MKKISGLRTELRLAIEKLFMQYSDFERSMANLSFCTNTLHLGFEVESHKSLSPGKASEIIEQFKDKSKKIHNQAPSGCYGLRQNFDNIVKFTNKQINTSMFNIPDLSKEFLDELDKWIIKRNSFVHDIYKEPAVSLVLKYDNTKILSQKLNNKEKADQIEKQAFKRYQILKEEQMKLSVICEKMAEILKQFISEFDKQNPESMPSMSSIMEAQFNNMIDNNQDFNIQQIFEEMTSHLDEEMKVKDKN